jgi:hypothetical protein
MPRPVVLPKHLVRCPKCTKDIVVQGEPEAIVCPTCGYRGRMAPGEWEVPPNLDGLRPGRQHELRGQHRPTAHVVLYTILTLGVYALVYAYRAFKEVDDQHGRLHATWWYLFGVLLLPLLVPLHVYWCIELRRLQTYRAARGMKRGIGPLGYSLWVLLLPVVGFIIALARVNGSLSELWHHVYKETGLKPRLA